MKGSRANRDFLDDLQRKPLIGYQPPAYPGPPDPDGARRRRWLHMEGNTNLLGPNPVLKRLAGSLAEMEVNQYPSEHSDDLRAALAGRWRVDPAQIVVGNGSDEVLDLLTKAFINPGDRIAYPSPSFVMYGFYAKVNLGKPTPVPLLGARFSLDVNGLIAARAPLTIVASPNNPTGNAFPREELERLLDRARGLVVIDEAYAEYAGQDFIREVKRRPNLVVTRTFSKAYGLASLRIGYAIGPESVIQRVYRAKPPYNVSGIGERIAIAALRQPGFAKRSVVLIARERGALTAELSALGFAVHPSDANFLAADSPVPAATLCEALRDRGILVKWLGSALGGPRGSVRITVGTRAQNLRLVGAIRTILREVRDA